MLQIYLDLGSVQYVFRCVPFMMRDTQLATSAPNMCEEKCKHAQPEDVDNRRSENMMCYATGCQI